MRRDRSDHALVEKRESFVVIYLFICSNKGGRGEEGEKLQREIHVTMRNVNMTSYLQRRISGIFSLRVAREYE